MSRKVLSLVVLATAFTMIVGVSDAEAGRRHCRSRHQSCCQNSNYGQSNCGHQQSWNDCGQQSNCGYQQTSSCGCQQSGCGANNGCCETQSTCCCCSAQSACAVQVIPASHSHAADQQSPHNGHDVYQSGDHELDPNQRPSIDGEVSNQGASFEAQPTPRTSVEGDVFIP